MSALPPEADIPAIFAECPLLMRSGHSLNYANLAKSSIDRDLPRRNDNKQLHRFFDIVPIGDRTFLEIFFAPPTNQPGAEPPGIEARMSWLLDAKSVFRRRKKTETCINF
jgi:hypothetical protein